MTTNEQLINIMAGLGMDTRPDPRTNHDAKYIAGLLGVSQSAVIGWLSPERWKKYRPMPAGYLEFLKIKLEKHQKRA